MSMSMRITDECVNCGACEPECPHHAISEGKQSYEIDRVRCTGCPGKKPLPCVEVCPLEECIVPMTLPSEPEARQPALPSGAAETASSPPETDSSQASLFLVPRIIWSALLGSTFVYLAVSVSVSSAGLSTPMMFPILGFVAVPLALLSLFLPARLLRSSLLRLELPVEEVADPIAESSYRQAVPSQRRFTEAKTAQRRAASALSIAMVIGLACAEAVSILGMVLRLQGASWLQGAGFFIVCWALMLAHFPSPIRLQRALERAYRARLQ